MMSRCSELINKCLLRISTMCSKDKESHRLILTGISTSGMCSVQIQNQGSGIPPRLNLLTSTLSTSAKRKMALLNHSRKTSIVPSSRTSKNALPSITQMI